MTERIDYAKIAEKVNYPALEKKLDELSKKAPPPRRKIPFAYPSPVGSSSRLTAPGTW